MNREEEIKQEAAKENKNTEKAIIDESKHELIDIDDILAEDNAVTRRIKNLFDYGITEEQVKNLFNAISNISSGDSLDDALQTLNQIFIVLASKITNSPDIPLVIDLATGERDSILSEIQAVELGISYDYITGTTIEIKNEAMMKIVSSLNLEEDFNLKPQVNIYPEITKNESSEEEIAQADMDFFKSSFEPNFSFYSQNNDYKDIEHQEDENNGKGTELSDISSTIEKSHMSEVSDTYFIDLLYKYMRHNPESPQQVEYSRNLLLENFKNGMGTDSKYYSEILGEKGEIDFQKIPSFLKNWQHDKNNSDLYLQLVEISEVVKKNDISDIQSFTDDSKEEVLLSLAKSLYSSQKDNVKLSKDLSKKLGIKLDKESIIEELNKHTSNSIQNEQDLEEYVASHEMNEKTYRKKIQKIRSAIKEDEKNGKKKATTAEEIYANKKSHKTNDFVFNTKKSQEIQKILDTVCDNRYNNEKKVMYILKLYQECKEQEKENHTKDDIDYLSLNSTIISKYMVKNGKYFSNFLNDKGNSVDPKKIEEYLKDVHLSPWAKSKVMTMKELIDSRVEEYDKLIEAHAEDLKEVRELIEKSKNEKSDELKKMAFELAKKIPVKAIDEKTLRELNNLDPEQYKNDFGKSFEKKVKRGIKDVPKALKYIGKFVTILPKVAVDAAKSTVGKMSNFASTFLNRHKKTKMLESGEDKKVIMNQQKEESQAKSWDIDEKSRKDLNGRLIETAKNTELHNNINSDEKGKIEEITLS